MIYHLLYPLSEYIQIFNITKYITFRGLCAFITSFLIVILFWNFAMKIIKRLKIGENVNMYGFDPLENLHQSKKGTPTMGGVLVILSVIISTLFWARWDNYLIWLSVFVIVALGIVGLTDDLLKLKKGKGLGRKEKLYLQILVGIILGILITINKDFPTTLHFPFFKRFIIDLGYFYIFWAALIIVSASNAVNFTDGLDGLAIGILVINFSIFAILSYISGHHKFSSYLFIPYIKDAGELAVLCLSLVGAGLGFLWFNSFPAQIFMGDVGALSLGGVIGAIALFSKKEFLLLISGSLFVAEALSVIIQICSVRFHGKKVFRAAPLHHHFQLLGWKEPKIIIRFWIISLLCAVITLLTLKLN